MMTTLMLTIKPMTMTRMKWWRQNKKMKTTMTTTTDNKQQSIGQLAQGSRAMRGDSKCVVAASAKAFACI